MIGINHGSGSKTMHRTRHTIQTLLAAALLALAAPLHAGGLALFTAEELQAWDEESEGMVASESLSTNSSGDGPLITIESPGESGTVNSPAAIRVLFVPGPSGELPDPDSFKFLLKKLITIDLTDRVSDYVTADGIDVDEADIPPGKYKFEMRIADLAGNESARQFKMKVVK